ncbi:hypothetical protein [Dyadobacter sp. CY343]|uniref:hypothetical protein n=1 Tax=Dyadobacter sp. CY343 TaxID=2907299 RepID=UPI001F164011|nr:hypothetical protein [Dyadobacter sp. CY343]MCE7061258.1 hypothetical protein [Dyadobacter sp. CY343]
MLGTIQKLGEISQSAFNAGFLTHLFLIRTDDISFQSDTFGNGLQETINSIEIKADTVITKFRLAPKTATLTEASSESADGVSYGTSISVPVKGPATELVNWIYRNAKCRFIVLTRDTTGLCYLAGKVENGCRISWGRQITNSHSHAFSITVVDWQPIRWVPTIDPELLFPEGDFDSSFDFSFS